MLLLPEGVDREAWDGYCDLREVMWKSKRVPWTERAKKIALRELTEWHEQGYDVNYVLDEAVLKGWRGLFINERTPKRAAPPIIQQQTGITRLRVFLQIVNQRDHARFRKDKLWEAGCSAALQAWDCLEKAS